MEAKVCLSVHATLNAFQIDASVRKIIDHVIVIVIKKHVFVKIINKLYLSLEIIV